MNTLLWPDKNPEEVLPYEVEFADRLLPGEVIDTADVRVLIFSGSDADPDAMINDAPTPPAVTADGKSITFTLTGGTAGAIYSIVVNALITSGNLYMKVGHLAIVNSDPFAPP